MVESSPVTNLDKRIEVSAPGSSVLPPQGENWCVKFNGLAGAQLLESPGERSNFRIVPIDG